ncbi:MAG: hypothetical protein ABEL51_01700 [Salinibacter sp.]
MIDLPDFWFFDTTPLGGLLLPLLLLLWIVLALTAGKVAADRGRGFARWVLIAVLITPVLALPLLWSLGRLESPGSHTMPLGSEVRLCPTCREVVSATPSYCSNCGAELPSDE